MTSVTPFLMFQGDCEAAVRHYAATVPGSEIVELTLHGADGPGEAGKVAMARVRLGTLTLMANDSPPVHAFTFTPSTSLWLDCADDAEFEGILAGLSEGGTALMPDGSYGFSRRFAWLQDRFGVSWQLNIA
jgi:predicted 3-demethylubiquinone-9 3-methyltransferase (glyoxalase superfamily)